VCDDAHTTRHGQAREGRGGRVLGEIPVMGSSAATPAGRRRARAGSNRAGSNRSGRRARGARRRAPSRRRSPWLRRAVAWAAILLILVAGYFLWLRDSSLLAVTDVSIEGVESAERERITAALTRAGQQMTTLNVDGERLESVAARFPTVESVSASARFPRGLEIEVKERPPVLAARSGDEEVAVAAGGMVLPGVETDESLPRLEVDRIPRAGRLEGRALAQALAIGAAPEPLRPLIRRAEHSRDLGVGVRMRGGIVLRFGSGANAEAKWAAAAAVLADPQLESVAYVDVRVPGRPAVGDSTMG
jgi:cell division protein FtsQ